MIRSPRPTTRSRKQRSAAKTYLLATLTAATVVSLTTQRAALAADPTDASAPGIHNPYRQAQPHAAALTPLARRTLPAPIAYCSTDIPTGTFPNLLTTYRAAGRTLVSNIGDILFGGHTDSGSATIIEDKTVSSPPATTYQVTTPATQGAFGVAVDQRRGIGFVSSLSNDTIAEIDLAATPPTEIKELSDPQLVGADAIAYSPRGNRLYVTEYAGSTAGINGVGYFTLDGTPTFHQLTGPFNGPRDIVYDPTTRKAYVVNEAAGNVLAITVDPGKADDNMITPVTDPQHLLHAPFALGIGAGQVYVTDDDPAHEGVVAIDTTDGDHVARRVDVTPGTFPSIPYLDPAYNLLAVSLNGDDGNGTQVELFKPDLAPYGTISGFNGPFGLTSYGRTLYVANDNGTTVSAVRLTDDGCGKGGGSPTPIASATPELSSADLFVTGLLPLGLALALRRRRARRAVQQ